MEILVCGATGHIGRHLVDQLLADGHRVRALTRTPHSADLPPAARRVQGDLTDVSTLHDAFIGVDAVHLITFGGDDGADLTTGPEIVDLARRSGIGRATVLGGWARTSVEHALPGSGIAWTRLEPVEIMLNTLDWLDEIREHRTVSAFARWPSAMVHEADIAAVALTALTRDGHGGKTYRLTGPEALTPAQRTRILAEATGVPLIHRQLSEAQERDRLAGHGFGDEYVEFGLRLATHPPDAADKVLDTVATVTGRPTRNFAQWATEHARLFT
ncbi:NAD(P)H-binding protein [Nocardia sp. PE-7]|uniref:NAD(P)H-binding protein n=1 Tax=Nocardia sp. PE-7 TaxID=3058426 RepID=UPI002659832E|nr:NAD(P)H-binding protein [Nocardia sp. PE-7]WKG08031.1 NAD(P)H-binding protein [Nocardia sp. PE-7]